MSLEVICKSGKHINYKACTKLILLNKMEVRFFNEMDHRVLAGKPKLSPFLVNWENVVFIYSIFFII